MTLCGPCLVYRETHDLVTVHIAEGGTVLRTFSAGNSGGYRSVAHLRAGIRRKLGYFGASRPSTDIPDGIRFLDRMVIEDNCDAQGFCELTLVERRPSVEAAS